MLALVLLAELLAALDVDWSPLANVTALVGNLALLGLVALGFGFGLGLGAIVVWSARRLGGQLARSLLLLARAIPLLLFFSLLLFLTTEMWQVFAEQRAATLIAIGLLLALVATAFLVVRLPREIDRLERDAGDVAAPLRRFQRANVGLVLLIGHGLQIVVVTLAIGAFFVAFGTIAIDAGLTRTWAGDAHALFSITVLDVPLRPTTELLRVSGAIAALSGLYYAISVLTDDRYREEFLDEITAQLRDTFAARAEYMELRASAHAPERL